MSFDLDAFCTGLTAASSSSEQAVCALQTIVAGVSKTVGGIDAEGITAGVDTFFLIFAVRILNYPLAFRPCKCICSFDL
jgi:hypothetical protein